MVNTGIHFLIFLFYSSQIKNYIITGLVSNFFYAPRKRVTSSLQKRNHHKVSSVSVNTRYILCIKALVKLSIEWIYNSRVEKSSVSFWDSKRITPYLAANRHRGDSLTDSKNVHSFHKGTG